MKRPRLQLHLSTLLVLSLGIAAMMYLNWRPTRSDVVLLAERAGRGTRVIADNVTRGWPYPCWSGFLHRPGTVVSAPIAEQFDRDRLLANIGVALGLLTTVTLLAEWRIRRAARASKKLNVTAEAR